MSKVGIDFLYKCKRFAAGRVGARRMRIGGTFEEALHIGLRWFPTVDRELFTPSNKVGFQSRKEALEDAKAIRERCRVILSEAA